MSRHSIFRYIRVVPLPTKNHPLIYRASYKHHAAYGRTAKQAVKSVSRKYYNSKLRFRDILNGIGISLLPPY